jgi:copper chaperone
MKAVIKIDGMSCQHCVMAVKKEIQKLDIQNFKVVIGEVSVEFDENKVSQENIKQAVAEAGFVVVD